MSQNIKSFFPTGKQKTKKEGWDFQNTYALKFYLGWKQLKQNVSSFLDKKVTKKRLINIELPLKLYEHQSYTPFLGSPSLLCLPHLAGHNTEPKYI